jgi:uncharacterized membrane protein YbjE (DUF340 family)
MIWMLIGAIAAGIGAGYWLLPPGSESLIGNLTMYALNFLLLMIGIEVGQNLGIFKEIRKHGTMLVAIPLGIIAGSAIGGYAASVLFHQPASTGLAIAAGYGWYSLSGILLTTLDSAQTGAVAFMSNIFRELMTIISVPFLAKYLNKYSAIAPAGATSMDSTLPVISRYTDPEIVIMAFFNGAVLSALVPLLVPFFYAL